MANVIVFFVSLALCSAYALAKGGRDEKIAAGIFLAATVLSNIAASGPAPTFLTIEGGILLVDVAMLVAPVFLALRSERHWPLLMAALQAVQVSGHMTRLADPAMIPWLYSVVQSIWAYPMMALLALATYRASRLRNASISAS